MCILAGLALHGQLLQGRQNDTHFAQHVRLIADKKVVICSRQVYDAHATWGVLKVFLPPIDVGCGGGVERLNCGAFLRVLRLIPWLITLWREKTPGRAPGSLNNPASVRRHRWPYGFWRIP